MKYSFNCYGHKNITAKHKTTLEFTKDENVSLKGECIVGVRADFKLSSLKKFIENKSNYKKKQLKNKAINKKTIGKIPIKIIIRIKNIEEKINGFLNADFNDSREIVIRKSDFISERTLIIKADKGACDLNRNYVEFLKQEKIKIKVTIANK
ncbi:MAG: hypothetical protein CL471_18065 [Acidobacteria bacterium]|jgi:hypothetical protein|nr:hypothetical protein [Acidobacteriota bacterium]|tara:strand:- start:2222 stop:2677 length:456 start_codon:yes stop_codon:yes gene_type:complete